MRWLLFLLVAVGAAAPATARDVAASDPLDVAVTIYRDPARNGGSLRLNALGGFAVVTETRQVTIPAGRSRLRFAGVVDGIIPASAIITGLPGGVIEKNQDSALLSPAALMRAARGRTITLARTNPVTGKPLQVTAEIVSASEQGVVFRTAAGTEALRCSGLPETFHYGLAAEGLSASPTLSVFTKTARAITTTVTLTYLAQGFDWSANYTAQLGPSGQVINLGGWLTLANANSVSLANARVQIVAGGLNREYVEQFLGNQPQVIARCWPIQTTSDIPLKPDAPYELVQPYFEQAFALGENNEIIVTGMQRMTAMQAAPSPVSVMAIDKVAPPEQLGDLKLYRIPQRTTVAAMQMKQTRLLDQPAVPIEPYYSIALSGLSYQGEQWGNAVRMMRTRNDKAHQLGLPLPAGSILFLQDQFGRAMVVGEPALADTAEGEQIELALGNASDITFYRRTVAQTDKSVNVEVTISNAGSADIALELDLNGLGLRLTKADRPYEQRNGRPLFRLTVPTGDRIMVRYTAAAN